MFDNIKLESAIEQAEADQAQLAAMIERMFARLRPALEGIEMGGRLLLDAVRKEGKHAVKKRCGVLRLTPRQAQGAMRIAALKIDWNDRAAVIRAVRLSGMADGEKTVANLNAGLAALEKLRRAASQPPGV